MICFKNTAFSAKALIQIGKWIQIFTRERRENRGAECKYRHAAIPTAWLIVFGHHLGWIVHFEHNNTGYIRDTILLHWITLPIMLNTVVIKPKCNI